MTDPTQITATELHAMLKRIGMSKTELSRRLEVNERTVRRWASGEVDLKGMAAIAVRAIVREEEGR